MKQSSIMPRHAAAIAVWLLLLLVLFAAAVNVPWALTFMRSRTTIRSVPIAPVEGERMPRDWPSATPHKSPWPAPAQWLEGGTFGVRVYHVYSASDDSGRSRFHMEVQHLGWPLPVIEQKQMWWDWNDATLSGPESDPALSIMRRGLLLNPIILGGAAWVGLVLPWLVAITATRWWRSRHHRCMACGYPVGVSAVCTECGSALREIDAASSATIQPLQ